MVSRARVPHGPPQGAGDVDRAFTVEAVHAGSRAELDSDGQVRHDDATKQLTARNRPSVNQQTVASCQSTGLQMVWHPHSLQLVVGTQNGLPW